MRRSLVGIVPIVVLEASSLHAWVESDASKDRLVQAMCRAVHDEPWLDRGLSSVDRAKLDD